MKPTLALLVSLLTGLTGQLNTAAIPSRSAYDQKPAAFRYDPAKLKESYAKIPLSFVANHGQADKNVKFTSRGSGYSLALAPTTFTLAVADSRKNNEHVGASVVQATLLGASAAAKLTGLERQITKTNYFIGSEPRRWKTNGLEDNQSGQRVKAHINECNNTAQAVIQIESGKKSTFVITAKDTSNSNCAP
jgi:hypothetical protein